MKVPSHFPNIIPEIISRGEPNPNKDIQIIQNKKKSKDLGKEFYQKYCRDLFVVVYNMKNHSILSIQRKRRLDTGKKIRL